MTVQVWVCEASGHVSNVARVPNAEGVRRCYFCPSVAREATAEVTEP